MKNLKDLINSKTPRTPRTPKQRPVDYDFDWGDGDCIRRARNGMIWCGKGAQELLDKDPSPEVAQELKDLLKAATLGMKKIDRYSRRKLSEEDLKALVALTQGLWDKLHAIEANIKF